ncbi:T9SS type A sorting domain-containing protein [Lewinella sp. JB7]|uniref:T9SS type A sorting domain-containing protein n=1 Tax=Lewinella sp. JB7 TaxID=2962887 RepID=UPI0020C9412E|nr:T9SS type A sorting domain-containing protein [Lewinella sp. JB7]MCP9235446.1 T9SS type A sorting domain-containing protein [Lewinella sp. JB7]
MNPGSVQGNVLTLTLRDKSGNTFVTRSITAGETNPAPSISLTNQTYYAVITGQGLGSVRLDYGSSSSNFSATATFNVEAAAPVTWTKPLSYAAAGEGVNLSWSVADQVDVDRYEVEVDKGSGFETAATVAYQEVGSREVTYTSLQPATSDGAYYRIKQLDFGGTFDYSNVIYVPGSTDAAALNVYPNPARDFVRVAVPERVETVELVASTGQVVRTYPAAAARDGINVSDLITGMYLLRVAGDASFTPQRLIVRR